MTKCSFKYMYFVSKHLFRECLISLTIYDPKVKCLGYIGSYGQQGSWNNSLSAYCFILFVSQTYDGSPKEKKEKIKKKKKKKRRSSNHFSEPEWSNSSLEVSYYMCGLQISFNLSNCIISSLLCIKSYLCFGRVKFFQVHPLNLWDTKWLGCIYMVLVCTFQSKRLI